MDALSRLDLLVLLKLAAHQDKPSTIREVGAELGLSKSSVANSLSHLRELDLLKGTDGERRINRLAVRALLEHAVRWVAPAKVGGYELGLPTAHSAEPLSSKLSGDADPLVLPLKEGPCRGRAVSPIHPQAPFAAQRDPGLLRLLAIVDAFRVGRARDRQVASEELSACL